MAVEIYHDEEKEKFYTQMEGQEAHLLYRETPTGTIDIYTTFVPPVFRGTGIAAELVQEALSWSRSRGSKVRPSCSYVEHFFQKNPRWSDLVE